MDRRRRADYEDALDYLDLIKHAFQHTRPGMYREFLNLMHAYTTHRSSTTVTIQWVSMLDIEHLDIIYGFKQFLHDEAAIRLVDLRIWYLVFQDWLRGREVEWSVQDWSRIWDERGGG